MTAKLAEDREDAPETKRPTPSVPGSVGRWLRTAAASLDGIGPMTRHLNVLLVVVAGLFLMRWEDRLVSIHDDDDYFAVATSIAFGEFPSFAHEFHWGEKMPYASVGPGMLAAPFVTVFSLLDRWEQDPICNGRTADNRYWTWSMFGFQFASIFYLLLTVTLLQRTLELYVSPFAAGIAVAALVFAGGGILMYAYVRPVMSHVYEIFAITWCVSLVAQAERGKRARWFAERVGIAAACVCLTRYNNFPLALGFLTTVPILTEGAWRLRLIALGRAGIPFGVLVAVLRILPVLANGYSTKDQTYVGVFDRLIPEITPGFYASRVYDVLFAAEMGLIFTGPAILLAGVAWVVFWRRGPRILGIVAVFALMNLYLVIIWKSFASYYGYRYFVFTAGPLWAIALGVGVEHVAARTRRWVLIVATVALCLLPMYSMTVFGRFAEFRISLYTNVYGEETIGDPDYHTRMLRTLGPVAIKNVEVTAKQGFLGLLAKDEWSRRERQRFGLYVLPFLGWGLALGFRLWWVRRRRSWAIATAMIGFIGLPLVARGIAGSPETRVSFAQGFYGEETGGGGVVWGWSRERGVLLVPSAGANPQAPSGDGWGWELRLEVTGLKPCHVWMSVGDGAEQLVLSPEQASAPVRVWIAPATGPTPVTFRSDLPAQPPGNGDMRELSFRILNPKLNRAAERSRR